MTDKKITFTTIYHQDKTEQGLSANDYILLDIIWKLEKNDKYPGWCYANREYLASCLGLTRPSTSHMITRLSEKGFIEKDTDTHFVKTTLNMLHSRIEYPSEEKNNGRRKDTGTPFNESTAST